MNVQRIQCYHYNEGFKVPFNSPQANRLRADSVIVYIDCGADGCGWGESAPRRYVTGEDTDSVIALIAHMFAPLISARSFTSVEHIEACIDALETNCRQNGIASYNAALAAVDLALLNALEQIDPTCAGALFPTEFRQALRFSASIPLLPLPIIETFLPIVLTRLDVKIVKVLIGENSDDNFSRVGLVRRLAGPAIELRLEMNGKLPLEAVHTEISRLMVFDPSAVEQPLPTGDIDNLRGLRERYGLAIVADESLVGLDDARRLIDAGGCDIFNLKISKCGGLIRSNQIARLAAQAGLDCQVGTHVGETELLGRAGRRFARGLPNFDCYGGGSAVLFSGVERSATPGNNASPVPDSESQAGARMTSSIGQDLASRSRLCADVDLSR